MLEVKDALALVLDAASPLPSIEVPLAEALGRVLAESVLADRDFPPTDRSAMDGFAVRAGDCASGAAVLAVAGELRAGQDPGAIAIGPGQAVRVFTGAMIPSGADAVVMQELVVEDARTKSLTVKERPEAGQHVRRRGEDLLAGDTVCAEGQNLRAAELAALAAVGRTRVRVIPKPTVSVLSTGDEIVEVAAFPLPHQIRNSNATMLAALLRSMGVTPRELGIAGDDTAQLDAAMATGLGADVFVLTGGVSVGAYDLVGDALSRAGCELLFHNVAMRPGKPILFARRGRCLVFGLPGNPVSALTGFHVFVAPALRKMMGEANPVAGLVRATLEVELRRRPGRLTFHLARIHHVDGAPFVSPIASASSGDLLSLVHANAFIVAPGDPAPIAEGVPVDVLPWNSRYD